MSRPLAQEVMAPAGVIPDSPLHRYLVSRRQDFWFIAFEGEEFGPYRTKREAMLFAVDAAHQFGEQGQETQVLAADEDGVPHPVWTRGLDPYPLPPE